jgi:hypothetical protein
VVKGKHSAQISSPSKQLKSLKLPDGSFSGDQKTISNDLATSTEQVPVASQVILPTRKTSRRKMDLKRTMIPKVNVLKNQISKYSISLQDEATHLKVKSSMCNSIYHSLPIIRVSFTDVLIGFWNYRTSFLV